MWESIAAGVAAIAGLLVYGPRIVKGIGSTIRAGKREERAAEAEEPPPAEYHREKAAHEAADASARRAKGAK